MVKIVNFFGNYYTDALNNLWKMKELFSDYVDCGPIYIQFAAGNYSNVEQSKRERGREDGERGTSNFLIRFRFELWFGLIKMKIFFFSTYFSTSFYEFPWEQLLLWQKLSKLKFFVSWFDTLVKFSFKEIRILL